MNREKLVIHVSVHIRNEKKKIAGEIPKSEAKKTTAACCGLSIIIRKKKKCKNANLSNCDK